MAASDVMIPTVAVPMKLCEIVVGPRRWLKGDRARTSFCARGERYLMDYNAGYMLLTASPTARVYIEFDLS